MSRAREIDSGNRGGNGTAVGVSGRLCIQMGEVIVGFPEKGQTQWHVKRSTSAST